MFENIVSSIGRFSYKHRKIIAILGIILFIAVVYLQSQAMIEYSYAEESLVTDIFPQDDTLVIVYNNKDEKAISALIEKLEKDERVTSIQAYANTLGMELSPSELADMLGIDVVFLNTLFYIYDNGMQASGMTFTDFITFISSDAFLENEMFAGMITDDYKSQLTQLGGLVEALTNGQKYSADEVASMFGIDARTIKIIYYIKHLTDFPHNYTPGYIIGSMYDLFGMDTELLDIIFQTEIDNKITFNEFVDTISKIYPMISGLIDDEQASQFSSLMTIADSIKNNDLLEPSDIAEMFSSMEGAEMLNDDTVTLLYIMSRGNTIDYSNKKIALYDFFMFISEEVISNESFSSFFDGDVAEQIESAKVQMLEGKEQLIGPEHSRMVLTLSYVPESPEINSFYVNLTKTLDSLMTKDYYLVGSTAMSYEVSLTFDSEFLVITLVTILVVMVVVLLTFRNIPISLLLICVIECAVFAMMSVMAITNSPMFFIAVILVQCILMGTMIDYAILFTTYYIEVRKKFSAEEALPEVMKQSTYAILTSSLILVLVTFICGLNMSGTVAAILQTLSIGAACAILLILFVLPSFLVLFDKVIIKNKNESIE